MNQGGIPIAIRFFLRPRLIALWFSICKPLQAVEQGINEMDLGLSGKRVLITGASKGIGRAIAEVLAEEGCSLHLASRTEADLVQARDEINEKYGVQVTIHPLDLSLIHI